jgi:3-hydroxyacyl-CoA dehydrogenase
MHERIFNKLCNFFTGWKKKYPDNPGFIVPKTLEKLVKEGKLGVKTGHGFYNYEKTGK